MKVKELIEALQKFDLEKEIVVRYDDHTDWIYHMSILKENIKLQEVWDESDDEFENGEKKVVIRVMEWE
jgi:hypothetical protein